MRLFVAIELADDVRRQVAFCQKSLRRFDECVRWTRVENVHLTLKFLGEVDDGQVGEIVAGLEVAAAESQPFEMTADHAGCFPEGGRVRIVWLGMRDESGRLATCQSAVETCMEAAGFAKEARKFSPHLTIGRVKFDDTAGRLRQAVGELELSAVEQPVESMVLMQSELGRESARYTKLGVWRLGVSAGRGKDN